MPKSYIDHCVVSNRLLKEVTHCEVLHEHLYNNSDHLPLIIHVNVCNLPILQHPVHPRVFKYAWNKLTDEDILHGYTYQLQDAISDVISSYTYRDGVLDPTPTRSYFLSKLLVIYGQLNCILAVQFWTVGLFSVISSEFG